MYRCTNDNYDADGTWEYDSADDFIAMCDEVFGVAPELRLQADGNYVVRGTDEVVLVHVR